SGSSMVVSMSFARRSRMSRLPSVDPASTTMYSTPCAREPATESTHSSRYGAWLNEIVTIDRLGSIGNQNSGACRRHFSYRRGLRGGHYWPRKSDVHSDDLTWPW